MLLDKYLDKGERGWEDVCVRVSGVMPTQMGRQAIYDLMVKKLFIPNSPCLMNAGRGRNMLACHLIHVRNSLEQIFDANKWCAQVFKSGGGVGLELSDLDPEGCQLDYAPDAKAQGPVAAMKLFNATAKMVSQNGLRKAAIMANINQNHTDVYKFVRAKQENGELSNFNISVTIEHGPTGVTGRLWDEILKNAHQNGEPGLVFLDNVNERNETLSDLGPIKGVNACSEIPLYDFGSCVLGSLNLPAIFAEGINNDGYLKLSMAVKWATRFLDQVIDVNHYPIKQIADATRRDRRIGIGVMGWWDLLSEYNVGFLSMKACSLAREISGKIYEAADHTSRVLAGTKGPYMAGKSRRNAVLTAIAPTGHISRIAGVSPSIYPDYALGLSMSPEEHVDLLMAWQYGVDSAISYTACFPNKQGLGFVNEVFDRAYAAGIKAISVYRDGSREGQPCNVDGSCSI